MEFSLRDIPFSTYGAYTAVAYFERYNKDKKGLYLKTLSGGASGQDLFNIRPCHGNSPAAFTEKATPAILTLTTDSGYIEMCYASSKELRIRGKDVDFQIYLEKPEGYGYVAVADDVSVVMNNNCSEKISITVISGTLDVSSPWNESGYGCSEVSTRILRDKDTGVFEVSVTDFYNSFERQDTSVSFEDCLKNTQKQYNAWNEKMLSVPEKYRDAAELASYLIWSSTVEPRGFLKRDAVLMSKNWMNNVWSWDHCFNAMALRDSFPELAWEQYLIPFDFQDKYGSLQDCVNDRSFIGTFVKPPIHGWTIRNMLKGNTPVDRERLEYIYTSLSDWTNWWFKYMDCDFDGLPQYMHGNDSGWDNSTVFRFGTPVESPDLTAYLVIQLDVLSELAEMLDKQKEAEGWKKCADDTLKNLIENQSDGTVFYAIKNRSHEKIRSDSLITCLPIILGNRLPDTLRDGLVNKLKDFLTEYGLATEKPSSEFYLSDGYWRGPIWAPPTLIAVDGLMSSGETEFAHEIAEKFCDLCAKSGMAENFDALTGDGLRDLSYTWTASVFLILANHLEKGLL